jgi:hypothetical protein
MVHLFGQSEFLHGLSFISAQIQRISLLNLIQSGIFAFIKAHPSFFHIKRSLTNVN